MNEAVGNIPYLVTSNSLKEKLSEYFSDKRRILKIWTDYSIKVGGSHYVTNGYGFSGVIFEPPFNVPEGWIKKRDYLYGMYTPKANSKDYKDLQKLPDLRENIKFFNKIVGFSYITYWDDLALQAKHMGTAIFKLKDGSEVYILLAPIPSDFKGRLEDCSSYESFVFADCKEIPWSEYFRLKEEDELITAVSEGKAGDA